MTLSASATDTDAGVARVVFQRSPAGQNVWTDICTDADDPFSCTFDTTTTATPNGSYDLRATATDHAGNVKPSSVVAPTPMRRRPSVTLGDVLSGNGLRTWSNAAALLSRPSTATTDLAGNPASAAPVAEGGTADKNF